jgi:two-component system response regulator MprA
MSQQGTSLQYHLALCFSAMTVAEHRHVVLYAEDDRDTREVFVAAATLARLDAVAVGNGREALDQLRGGLRPCLIVIDWAMPVMDGLSFRRAQLADPDLQDIPVVVLSAGGWAAEADALKVGLTTFLRKPIGLDAFIRALGDYCAADVLISDVG